MALARSFKTLAPGQQFYYGGELVTVLHGPLRFAHFKASTPHEPWMLHSKSAVGAQRIELLVPALPTTPANRVYWYIKRADGYTHPLGITGFCALTKNEATKVSKALTAMVTAHTHGEAELSCSEHKQFKKVLHQKGEEAARLHLSKRGHKTRFINKMVVNEKRVDQAMAKLKE